MAANDSLKFAAGPRETAQTAHDRGRIAATVRYDLENPPSPGDRLRLLTPEGDRFATGYVESVLDTRVGRVMYHVGRDAVAYGHDSRAGLLHALNGHYSDEIDAVTPVKVVYYRVNNWEGVP